MFGTTSPQPKRGPCDWAYCTRPDDVGRWAVDYVRATNERDAKVKAKAKAERRLAKVLGYKSAAAMIRNAKAAARHTGRKTPRGYTRRVYVWRDNDHECAPGSSRDGVQ